MGQLIFPKTDVILPIGNKIKSLTDPLIHYDIGGFGCTRIYDDQTMLTLSDRPDVLEALYYSGEVHCEDILTEMCPELLVNHYLLSTCRLSHTKLFKFLAACFNATYLFIFSKRKRNYYETYWFGCIHENEDYLRFCVNHTLLFDSFINYFLKESAKLIQTHQKNPTRRLFSDKELLAARLEFLQEKNRFEDYHRNGNLVKPGSSVFYDPRRQRYYLPLNHPVYFTAREMECAQWFGLGKSADEIAIILGVSRKTIENHLENMKKKLDSCKQTDLLRKLFSLKIIECY